MIRHYLGMHRASVFLFRFLLFVVVRDLVGRGGLRESCAGRAERC